jgi:hypothetical protein
MPSGDVTVMRKVAALAPVQLDADKSMATAVPMPTGAVVDATGEPNTVAVTSVVDRLAVIVVPAGIGLLFPSSSEK